MDLIGVNAASFSIAVETAGGNTDDLLFTTVNELESTPAFGFTEASAHDAGVA